MAEDLERERRRIRAHIDRDEAELHEAMAELAEAVEDRLDPRSQIAAHPYPLLLGGLVVGFLLGWRRT